MPNFKQFTLITLLMFIEISIGMSQTKKLEWFPESSAFPVLQNDVLECITYSGIFYFQAEEQNYTGAYIPVNLGVIKPIVKTQISDLAIDFSIGAASFTQFEIIRYDQNTLRGGLLNNDYKATGFLSVKQNSHIFRLQLFHISSHLGDDYMIRNEYFERNDKSVNYEQLDITYLKKIKTFDVYSGIGMVITPHAYRKRFMAQVGFQGNKNLSDKIILRFASDIKFYHEHNFLPNAHTTVGLVLKSNKKMHATLNIDHYWGHIPYSTLKFGKVWWVGPSTSIYF